MAAAQGTPLGRHWISSDGKSQFTPEANRYHLYASLACPFALRTLVVRELKGLQKAIPCTIVDWHMRKPAGWKFNKDRSKCSAEPLFGCEYLSELYFKVDPNYQGKYSVPVLWDTKLNTIVNNESAEIILMMNDQFNDFCATPKQAQLNLYPKELQSKIVDFNKDLDANLLPVIFACGFSTTQAAYEEKCTKVFEFLDKLEKVLSRQRYLIGSQMTLTDVRAFTPLLAFDLVYHGLFKLNVKRLVEYPNLWGFMRDMYTTGSVAEVVDGEHIRSAGYNNNEDINPHGIIAVGPVLDFKQPHGREKLVQ